LFKVEEIKQQVQAMIQETVPVDEAPVKAIDDKWHDIHQDVTQITTELLGNKTIGGVRKKSTPYWTQELKEAVHAKNQALRLWMKHRTAGSRKEYVEKRNLDNTQRRVAKEECWLKLGKDLEEDVKGNKTLMYNLAKSYHKGDDVSVTTVKDEAGNLCLARWRSSKGGNSTSSHCLLYRTTAQQRRRQKKKLQTLCWMSQMRMTSA
jgi:hypothetical protein